MTNAGRSRRRSGRAFVAVRFAAEAITRGAALLLLPLLSKTLGLEAYGVHVQIAALIGLLAPMATLGLGFGVVRFMSSETGTAMPAAATLRVVTVVAIAGTALAVPMYFAAAHLDRLFFKSALAVPALRVSAVMVPLAALETLMNDIYRSRLEIASYSAVQSAQAVLTVVVAAIVLQTGGGLVAVLASFACLKAVAVAVLIASALTAAAAPAGGDGGPRPVELGEMMRFGWPLVVMSIGTWLMALGDRFVIGYFLDAYQVGLYGAAYTVAGVLAALGSPFWTPLFPLLAAARSANDRARFVAQSRKYMTSYLLIGVPGLVGLIAVSPEVLEFATPGAGDLSWIVFGVIAGGLFANQISTNAHYTVYLYDRPVFVRNVTLAGGVLNFLLNVALVPLWGVFGAGFATLIAYVFIDVLLFLKIRLHGFAVAELYDFAWVARTTAGALCMVPVIVWLRPILPEPAALAGLVVGGAVVYALALAIIAGRQLKAFVA